MNRRSILSSLSSLFLAALAWPRRAEAGHPPVKVTFNTFTTKLYNGFYVQNSLVPGQIPLNVSVNGRLVTLSGGATQVFTSSNSTNGTNSTVIAKTETHQSIATFAQAVNGKYPSKQIIYVLVSVNTPDGVPTITQAPDGVTW